MIRKMPSGALRADGQRMEEIMSEKNAVPLHIQTTEIYLRFYVFLGKCLDRCLDESEKASVPEQEFQRHFQETRTQVGERFASNQRVKDKLEQEYERVTQKAMSFTKNPNNETIRKELSQERELLKIKALTLSDLLAVFRST